jgi:hypothetical protein
LRAIGEIGKKHRRVFEVSRNADHFHPES